MKAPNNNNNIKLKWKLCVYNIQLKSYLKKNNNIYNKIIVKMESPYSAYKKLRHTIQMTNDRSVYVLIDQW